MESVTWQVGLVATGTERQTIYINLDHVITAERVREYTLVKFSDGSETVVEPPELVVCAIQSGDERRREKNIPIPTQHVG